MRENDGCTSLLVDGRRANEEEKTATKLSFQRSSFHSVVVFFLPFCRSAILFFSLPPLPYFVEFCRRCSASKTQRQYFLSLHIYIYILCYIICDYESRGNVNKKRETEEKNGKNKMK